MKYNKPLVLILALLLIFSVNALAKTKKLTRVGVYPLMHKGKIESVGDLQKLVEEHAEDIKIGFEKAGASSLYPAFMEEVKKGNIEDKIFPKGEQFEWMVFKVGKKVKAVDDLVWAANRRLEAYALTVQYECKDYFMAIPKLCGNITLHHTRNSVPVCDLTVSPEKANIGDPIKIDMSGSKCATKMKVTVNYEGQYLESKDLSPANPVWETKFNKPGNYEITGEAFNDDGVASQNECKAKVYINYPPECDLKVEPTKGYTNQKFKLDASGSTDKDGKVVKAEFTIKDENGNEVDKQEVTTDPLIWEKVFKKSGRFKVYLKVTDDFGAVSAKVCELEVLVEKRFYLLAEAGPMLARGTYTGYVFGRLGFAYLLVPDRLSFLASAGGGLKLAGDAFKNHFLSNILLNLHFDGFFLGGGVGFSSAVRDDWNSDVDIVGNIGFDVWRGFNKRISLFGEVRYPVKQDLKWDDAHAFLVGIRFLF